MNRQWQVWRSGSDGNMWLSMLVHAMEEASRPELRALSCDEGTLAGLRAQLACPASPGVRATGPGRLN